MMSYRRLIIALLFFILVILELNSPTSAASSRSQCFRNCHLCQQMYGANFQGHLCAHTCIKLRGRLTPDCTDLMSIAPFLDMPASNDIDI